MRAPSFDIATLRSLYLERRLTPRDLVDMVCARTDADRHNVWITRLTRAQMLVYADTLALRDPEALPLYGVPFAIKDNIDLAGVPTTAGCPAYAYTPAKSAIAVQRLIDAGAIPVGKTNLDQFATGLVGTRSPYGACRNSFDPDYIAGGSSAGSAVAVALGQVSFALGTDTAGSGRVPAALNNLIGLKPTRGLISTRGVVPACRTLDCVSILALTVSDARAVLDVSAAYDPDDPYARRPASAPALPPGAFRFGVPKTGQLEFFGNDEYAALFVKLVETLQTLGGAPVEIDFTPFLETARLLYEGPWVAERYCAILDFLEAHPAALHPVTHAIIARGREPRALDAYAAMYRLAALKRAIEPVFERVDAIVTPTVATTYRIAEIEHDPIRLNSRLGHYTNFMNLLDLAAVAAPAGFTGARLPFGITLFAEAFSEPRLLALAGRLERSLSLPAGAGGWVRKDIASTAPLPEGYVAIAVCGAHLAGLPLNIQLTARGGFLLESTRTAPRYRFYALPGAPPPRPGLVRVAEGGASIAVEVWALPLDKYGAFVAGIAPPLGVATIELIDGRTVQGFVCEGYAVAGACEITAYRGWRAYLDTL